MLSPQLRRKVHDLWSLFWSSGLSNPLVAIEQITYLLFIRQLEALDRARVAQNKPSIYALTAEEKAQRDKLVKELRKENKKITDTEIESKIRIPANFEKCRWSNIRQPTAISFALLNDTVFPWLRELEKRVGPAQNGNTTLSRISGRLSDAYFVLDPNKSDTLKRAVSLIDELFRQLDTRSVNSDIMGDIFEYLLEEVSESGKNGQFRTPRHVIRFMVQLLDPELGKTVLDPACGTGGFLLNTLVQWKANHTPEDVLCLEWDGTPHNTDKCSWPRGRRPDFSNALRGYDNDRTMVRIAWMNLLLHDIESPEVHQLDTLSKQLDKLQAEEKAPLDYDYILANPPFTGSVDEGDLSRNKQRFPTAEKGSGPITTKSELLFVWLMLDLLKIGGRVAVIVPDGVLFGSTIAHRALRRQLLFENTLEAVVSLPANIFQPYSGVKTSILVFQKAGEPVTPGDDPRTREVWFYEVSDEAYSLDQKRRPLYGQDNDLWDAVVKFRAWSDYREGGSKRGKTREARRAESIGTDYHQPAYWEERWRAVDDDFLKVFPEKSGDKGHTFPLHELWRSEFRAFDTADPRGARQYDDAVLARVRPVFAKEARELAERTVAHAYAEARAADRELGTAKVLAAAEKNGKALANALNKLVREQSLFDREFDQFGLSALRTLLKELAALVPAWVEAVAVPAKAPVPKKGAKTKPAKLPSVPEPESVAEALLPQLRELARLDGYNVWRRGSEIPALAGKLVADEAGVRERRPSLQSWIVPVRKWQERESWGEGPETERSIGESTHHDGIVREDYLDWLRDEMDVFENDATVKEEHLDRLDPDCLEALDFNLSAGRHKPFIFDPGQHRPPAELIHELLAIHGDVQKRLGKLLATVGKEK